MELQSYEVENDGEFTGQLTVVIESEGESYTVEFDFEQHGTSPTAHSPFPSPEKDIYAWPSDGVPEELVVEAGTDEAVYLGIVGVGLPDSITLLDGEYSSVDSVRSPFISYPE